MHYATIRPFVTALHLAPSPVISPQVVDSPSRLAEHQLGRSADAGRKQSVSDSPAAPSNERDQGRQNLVFQRLVVHRGPGNELRNPGHG